MRRGKPHQQIYRPGSGPLKKTNTIDESESDTNILINTRQTNAPEDSAKIKSAGSSPRDKITNIDSATSKLGDFSLNNDVSKRPKKPEQMRYVPRPLARELNTVQDMNRNTFVYINGNDKHSDSNDKGGNQRVPYSDRSPMERSNQRNDWREEAARHKQISDRRGPNPTHSQNWNRPRDTRSVEPSGPNRNYNEKIQAKPPTGRRHSTVGIDPEQRYQMLPPRLQKKFLEENNIQPPTPVEDTNWDGSSVTFQKNPSSNYQMSGAYYTLPMAPGSHHQHLNFGSNLLPGKPRGRGRLSSDQSMSHSTEDFVTLNFGSNTLPGKSRGRGRVSYEQDIPHSNVGVFDTLAPDRLGSPNNSRPPTPTSRPHTPVNMGGNCTPDSRRSIRRNDDFGSRNQDRRDNNQRRDYNRRDSKNFNNFHTRDNYSNRDHHRDQRWEDDFRDGRQKERYNRDGPNRDPHHNYHRDGPHRDNFNRDGLQRDNYNRDGPQRDNYNRDGPQRDNYNRVEAHNREVYNREREGYNNRDNYQRDNYNRDGQHNNINNNRRDRDNRRGGNNRDRRRDNRRERDRRSRSKDANRDSRSYQGSFSTDISVEESWEIEETVSNVERGNISKEQEANEDKADSVISPEDTYRSIIPELLGKTLDWSEEVELNDRLESEYLSDALTRSSSIVSLQDVNATKSLPPNINEVTPSKKTRRRNRRSSRNRSRARDGSHSGTRNNNRTRQNSTTSIDSRDSNFKVPREPYPSSSRRSSKDTRDNSFERYNNSSRNVSRDSSWDRQHRGPQSNSENWREEIERSRKNSDKEGKVNLENIKNVDVNTKKAGVIVLPQHERHNAAPSLNAQDYPSYPDARRSPGPQQKSLYDPNNPSKPIIVKSSSARVNVPGFSDNPESAPPQMYATDQFGNPRPPWYEETSPNFSSCHYPNLLRDVKTADNELQFVIDKGLLLVQWDVVDNLRQFLKKALEYLICKAIKFCQAENVEQHFWKILYHNIIEVTRKAIKNDSENKEKYKGFLLFLIDEGSKYFEGLLSTLEETYDFKLNNFLKENHTDSEKRRGWVGLALVSAQKLLLFLGDLSRYREEVNETSNYGKCRQWYIKSHEINPKNGKPYNQLAILAVHARRKLDAVYYYMRSLMSSNPVPSARESLNALFYENKKKYDQGEKKRREERLERQRLQMKQKESEDLNNSPGQLRRETWIHPEGGRRVYRTTQANLEQNDSDEEDLTALSSVEVNKRFVISYLHVQGKLITKIGMETFQEAAMQMLKEFRALLQDSPIPIPSNRLLQLLALNMYAIYTTKLKDPQLQSQPRYRSELQERALIVSLQMFNLILERCVSILQEHITSHKDISHSTFHPDANVLLPAVKIWCDWLLCHTSVWNPPPSTQDFKVGTPGDCWTRLATLMTLLEQMDQKQTVNFVEEPQEGYEFVGLPEDTVLSEFTPLNYKVDKAPYAPNDVDIEYAQFHKRLKQLHFYGTEYLCGVDPPVLKLEIEDGVREYVSVVCTSNSRDSPPNTELAPNSDVLLESFSDENEDEQPQEENITPSASTEIRELLTRKVELEKRKRSQDLHMQRVKKILSQAIVSVHVEVRPKYLVPDTNCFIDHMVGIRTISQSHPYTLMVPIVVLSELEGLSRGGKVPLPDSRSNLDPQHVKKVAASAKEALDFLKTRHTSVKCVTTKGAILPSTNFSTEDDAMWDNSFRNDDKILSTCLGLCKWHKESSQDVPEGEPRHLVREVVLLTDDRNLRVKAYARDVPVRELPDFMRWAGLG